MTTTESQPTAKRVVTLDGAKRGTIVYEGEVKPYPGTWFGVDWDDPEAGKHDGSHDGVHYFQASHPKSGSFVRSGKIRFGCSLTAAVKDKYGVIDEDVYGHSMGSKKIEIIGFESVAESQKNFDKLKQIVVSGSEASTSGSEDITCLFPKLRHLDISNCLFHSWLEIVDIVQKLNHLELLNMNYNRMEPVCSSGLCPEKHRLEKLKSLFMVSLGLSLEDVLFIARIVPMTEIIGLAKNNFTSLSTELVEIWPNLTNVDVQDNILGDWAEVLKLGSLKNLVSLNVNNCGIPAVFFPDVDQNDVTVHFPQLKIIHMTDNLINEWQSFIEFDKLGSLEQLRVNNNPVLAETATMSAETARQLVIASIRRLRFLNRAEILPEERRGAQIDYLKHYGLVWLHSRADLDKVAQFALKHPRYAEFVEAYGPPEASELKVVNAGILKENMISVQIESNLEKVTKKFLKKLPLSMTVRKLKTLVGRLYKCDPRHLELEYHSVENPDIVFLMENDTRPISFYSVDEGDLIIAVPPISEAES